MIQQPNDPFISGEMTGAEFIKAEIDIDPKLPDFEQGEMPIVKMMAGGHEISCNYYNTVLVTYPDEWEKFSHILIAQKSRPLYLFKDTGTHDNEAEHWTEVATVLMKQDFPRLLPEERPRPDVMEVYYRGLRGNEPIEEVIGRLLMKE